MLTGGVDYFNHLRASSQKVACSNLPLFEHLRPSRTHQRHDGEPADEIPHYHIGTCTKAVIQSANQCTTDDLRARVTLRVAHRPRACVEVSTQRRMSSSVTMGMHPVSGDVQNFLCASQQRMRLHNVGRRCRTVHRRSLADAGERLSRNDAAIIFEDEPVQIIPAPRVTKPRDAVVDAPHRCKVRRDADDMVWIWNDEGDSGTYLFFPIIATHTPDSHPRYNMFSKRATILLVLGRITLP
ncbi:hypothetical protein CC80DRAFT_110497 [Byssothecium circinans]|uniref:Uncharacterized protein n=1 Tax=Byssothecium circinans TaxID=147558 RepID=A0A6A5TRI5_9PLEO|nr:hypothetical protein CC80DRAFT_110497 [Byssothecium circinans]